MTSFRSTLWWACLLVMVTAALAEEEGGVWVEEIRSPIYFALYVEDVDRSVDWYREVFGLEELVGSSAEDGSWRIQNLGNRDLAVEIIRDDRAESVNRALGFRKVGFYSTDLEGIARRVEAATGERPSVFDFEPLRQRILQIRDPDGNIIQVMSEMPEKDSS